MNNPDFKVNAKLLPDGFPREFDAHIYFSLEQLELTTFLRDKMKIHFLDQVFFVGDIISKAFGPHPEPMFEANFPLAIFSDVVLWLMKERREFSVLVHPLSGDDVYDHTRGAMCLGRSIELLYYKT